MPSRFPETTLRAAVVVPPTTLLEAPDRNTPVLFPIAAVPAAFVPTRLPATRFPVAPGLDIITPIPLPETRLPAPALVPPTVFPALAETWTPIPFARAASPVEFVP